MYTLKCGQGKTDRLYQSHRSTFLELLLLHETIPQNTPEGYQLALGIHAALLLWLLTTNRIHFAQGKQKKHVHRILKIQEIDTT